MLLLTTTSDIIRLITDAGVTVDVHASFMDYAAASTTPGSQNTAISTATTTTVVAAPGASTQRNVKLLSIRNRSASSTVGVTVQLYNGATAYELEKVALGPGQSAVYHDGRWFFESSSVSTAKPWHSVVMSGVGDGDPGTAMAHMQRAGNVAGTPTNISTSVARCSLFIPPADITVNRIRCYGVGATTNVYRVAIYRLSDLARLTAELAFTTSASTWVNIGSALALSLTAGTAYFVACAVNATGTTAGVGCLGGTVAATTGQVATAPGSLPGSLATSGGYLDTYCFQFAVSTGALPATAATLAAQAAWTGGMPLFWLDSADV